MSEDVDSGDHIRLIRSNSSNSKPDLEALGSKNSGITGLLKQLDRRLSGRLPSRRHHDGGLEPFDRPPPADALCDGVPPEWVLLLIGSLLGLATGLCVAAFNHGSFILLTMFYNTTMLFQHVSSPKKLLLLRSREMAFRKYNRATLRRKELFKNTLRKAAYAWKRIVELHVSDVTVAYS